MDVGHAGNAGAIVSEADAYMEVGSRATHGAVAEGSNYNTWSLTSLIL